MTADTSDRKCRTFSPFKFGLHPPRHFSEIFLSLATARFSFHRIICTKSWIGWDYAESAWFWDNWGWQRCADLRVKIPIREQRVLCRTVPAFLPWIWNKLQLHWFPLLVPFVKPQLMVEPLRGQKKKILLSSKPFTAAFTGSDLIEHFTRSFLTFI